MLRARRLEISCMILRVPGSLLCCLLIGLNILGQCLVVAQNPVTLSLLSDKTAAVPGETFKVAVRANIEPEWHIYWTNPGETGLPTIIKWGDLPDGCTVSEVISPIPKRYTQKITDAISMVSHTFEGDVFFVAEVAVAPSLEPGSTLEISADVDWQACKEICTAPTTTPLKISLPVRVNAADSSSAEAIDASLATMEQETVLIELTRENDSPFFELTGLMPDGDSAPSTGAIFVPSVSGLVPPNKGQDLKVNDNAFTIKVPLEDEAILPENIAGFLINPDGSGIWLTSATQESNPLPDNQNHNSSFDSGAAHVQQAQIKEIRSWGLTNLNSVGEEKGGEKGLLLFMLLALAGGIILNLMPCVFPVLGIKIMGFVQQAGEDSSSIRKHGWVFTCGVVLSLWALVGVLFIVRYYGESAGWGFQLQEPGFVLFMILLMFVFALNLCGLFEFGTSAIGVGSSLQSKSGLGGAFFSGVLAVLVATPCTGPFMAPALGYALSQPLPLALLVFTMLAIGLALPYLLLSYFPFLIRKLPRPGAWMETFKQFMSFPMFATAIWLMWIFASQTNQNALFILLVGMLTGSLGLWIYGKYNIPSVSRIKRRVGQCLGVLLVTIMVSLGYVASKEMPHSIAGQTVEKYGITWEAFDTGRIIDLREQGKTVFIDFTARW